MLITEIPVGKGQVVGIVSPVAVQRLTLGNGAELVLVHPIGVLPLLLASAAPALAAALVRLSTVG